MLIISKFQDYYDSVAFSKGVDKSIVYKRDNSKILENKIVKPYGKKLFYFPFYSESTYSKHWKRYGLSEFKTYIIGFCGKLYPLMVTSTKVKSTTSINDETVTEYVYDLDTIREHHKKYCSIWEGNMSDYEAMLTSKVVEDLFFEHKVPYFIISSSRYDVWGKILANGGSNLELNPILKEIEFYRVFETAAAFQEIEMFISGVLGVDTVKPIEVSDKSKIEGHGFDYKTSFRKEKK